MNEGGGKRQFFLSFVLFLKKKRIGGAPVHLQGLPQAPGWLAARSPRRMGQLGPGQVNVNAL